MGGSRSHGSRVWPKTGAVWSVGPDRKGTRRATPSGQGNDAGGQDGCRSCGGDSDLGSRTVGAVAGTGHAGGGSRDVHYAVLASVAWGGNRRMRHAVSFRIRGTKTRYATYGAIKSSARRFTPLSPDGRLVGHLNDMVAICRNRCFRWGLRVVLVLIHVVRAEGLLWRRGSTGFPWRGRTTSS